MDNSNNKKSITSKSYFTMNIGEWEIGFYYPTMENDDNIYIDTESVENIVERSIESVETIDVNFLIGKNAYKKEAYFAADFIEHLKPKPLKYIARYGLKMILDNPLFDEYEDTPPSKERDALSDFDKNILKAMQFNPKKK